MDCPNYNTAEPERKVGQHLQREDRGAIQHLRRLGYSNRAIAREQVAAKLQLEGVNLSRDFYAHIESGVYNIRASELAALQRIFKCSYDVFFEGC